MVANLSLSFITKSLHTGGRPYMRRLFPGSDIIKAPLWFSQIGAFCVLRMVTKENTANISKLCCAMRQIEREPCLREGDGE